MKALLPLVASLCVLTAVPLQAQAESSSHFTTGPFVSLAIGGSSIAPGAIVRAETGDTDHSNGLGKLSVGYWFAEHWGVSASYMDMGEFTQTYTDGSFKGQVRSASIDLLGRVALSERWALVGKMMLVHNKTKRISATGNTAGFDKLHGDSTRLVLPGLEINYRVNDAASVYFEMESRGKGADKLDLGYAGVGLRWQF